MSLKHDEIARIEAIIAPIVGQAAWGASLGIGSFLTIEFGHTVPLVPGEAKVHGEWHLWVCHCAWRIDTSDAVLAGSDDEPATMREAIDHLNGQVLHSFSLSLPAPDARLAFGDDTVLTLFPMNTSGDYEYWILFTPDGNALTLGEQDGWSFEAA